MRHLPRGGGWAGPLLAEPSDEEMYMLESLPILTDGSRLSCQVKITPNLDGLVVRLMPQMA